MADESLRAAPPPPPPPTRFGLLASYWRGAPRNDSAPSATSPTPPLVPSSVQRSEASRQHAPGPITAPGGWGALLTWRGAQPLESATTDESDAASHKDAETSAHASAFEAAEARRDSRSRSGTQPRRSRAAIPFDRESGPDADSGGGKPASPQRDARSDAPHIVSQTDQLSAKLAEAASPAHAASDAPTPAYATLSRLSKRPSFASMQHAGEASGPRRVSVQASRAVDAGVWREEWTAEKEANEKIDEVVRLCISQAGLDWE